MAVTFFRGVVDAELYPLVDAVSSRAGTDFAEAVTTVHWD